MSNPCKRVAVPPRLATLASEPGVSVARLTMEHGLNAKLLFKFGFTRCSEPLQRVL